jgi:hypothetical protein
MKRIFFCLLIIFAFFVIESCKKSAGSGGTSKIQGMIWVQDFNSLNSMDDTYQIKSEYPGADEDVYIIYGNDASYGDKVRSGPDGKFEFKYLRSGDYKIYLQSKDTNRTSVFNGSGIKTLDTTVSISGKRKTIDLGTFVIYK